MRLSGERRHTEKGTLNFRHRAETGRRLRIALLSIHSGPLGRMGTRDTGGMNVTVRELARELGGRGHRMDIFTRWVPREAEAVAEPFANVRVVPLRVEGAEQAPKEALAGHADAFADRIAAFAPDPGDRYDLVHSHYWVSGAVGRRVAAARGLPHAVTFHTLGIAKTASREGHAEHGQRLAEEADLASRCDAVVAPTEAERARIASLPGARPDAIHVVPCGVDLERFRPREEDAPPPEMASRGGGPVLLFVGRFDPMKGMSTLLAAAARLSGRPPAELVMAGGDGPGSPGLERMRGLALELGIADRVRFAGPVHHSEMPRYYRAADAVVVASRYESFGLAILEALACGTPVAATPVGVAPEVIRDGVTGCLSSGFGAEELAQAVARTLSLAPDRLQVRAAVSGFAWPRVADRLLDVYDAVLARQRPLGRS